MRHGQPKLFKSIGTGLPYDAEVEWLQNNNKSYIDTGIKLNQATDSMGCRFQPVSASATYCIFCGTRRGAYYSLNFSNNHVCFDYQSGGYLGTIQPENRNGLHTWECRVDETANTASLFRDGKLITTRQRYRNATSVNAWVFVANDEYRSLYGRVSEFWITRSGKYLIHLISVRFTNELGQSEGAMYDKVSGRLFRNSGTGSFIIGADKTKETIHGAPKNPVKPYDIEVDYIESSGTQWIDTGIKLNQTHTATLKFQMMEAPAAYRTIFGARSNWGNRAFDFWWANTGDNFAHSFDGKEGAHCGALRPLNAIIVADLGSVFKINGLTINTTTGYTDFETVQTGKLFGMAWNGGSGISSGAKMRCYSLVIRSNGETVMDLVPVVLKGKGCMYDRANPNGGPLGNGLYMNQGTGDFIVGYHGRQITSYDAEVEYLESDGNQWIDTGVRHDSSNAIRFKLRMPLNSAAWTGAYGDYIGENYRTSRTIYESTLRTSVSIYHATSASASGGGAAGRVIFSNVVGSDRIIEGYTSNSGNMINGVSKASIPCWGGLSDNTMKLFYSNSSAYYAGGARIYYFKIDNQCDFIPVRFTNELGQSEGAMYDKVSGQLFRNKGTGNFVVGPDKT